VDVTSLRDELPVLAGLAYLNSGTNGPLPTRAVQAAVDELRREAYQGRARAHFEHRHELADRLRGAYAAALACDAADVALTTCTSEGIAQVVNGLPWAAGDEVVTSDEEHPGLLGALSALAELHRVEIRAVPLERVVEAVGPRTRLVACSHVSWMSGRVAPRELAEVDVPVLLDGAQGVGAIAVDVHELRCDAYAGAGQKWLCGPDGTGMLFVTGALRDRLAVSRRGYGNLADPGAGLRCRLHDDARRFDAMSHAAETLAAALAAVELLQSVGLDAVRARARELAARLAQMLAEAGRDVAARGDTTLVAFQSADPEGERARLAEAGVVVRDIPGRSALRASVGAWNDEHDLERLLTALGA
jgi:selenocysteine lyase/cysteine desulfurase